MKQRLFFLICGTLVCSCTITKRHFSKGYHVEWARKIKTGVDREENLKTESIENQVVIKNIDEPDSIPVDKFVLHDQPIAMSDIELIEAPEIHPVKQPQVWSEEKANADRKIEITETKLDKEEKNTEEPKRKMHPLMWGIWAMWSAAIVCMFFVTFYVEALIGVSLGFFIAMIFALIVLRSMRKKPVKQPFKGLSYGFGIPAIVFGVIASAGLGLILVILLLG